MIEDRVGLATQGAALLVTAVLAAFLIERGPVPQPIAAEAPPPTQVTLSVVKAPPPPPPPPPEAVQPPPPPPPEPLPPVEATPSPLPPPPRVVHRVVHRPRRPPPQHPVPQDETPRPPVTQPEASPAPRPPSQAPENHSAEAAFVGRLHTIVEGDVTLPESPAYRLQRMGGEAVVGFTLSRAGGVSGVHVMRSSGFGVIDQQALVIVGRARFPTMPGDVYPGQPTHPFSTTVFIPAYSGGTGEL